MGAGWTIFRVKMSNGRNREIGICLQLSVRSRCFVRGGRWENSCAAYIIFILLVYVISNLQSLFLGCLLKEGLDGAGLFACGVIFRFRGWLGGGLSGREKALGWTDITGKKASNPPCWWSVAKFASWEVEQGEGWSPGDMMQDGVVITQDSFSQWL